MADYGVLIKGGAMPWQIFQQNESGKADISVYGDFHLIHLSQELPLDFSQVENRKTVVKARLVYEDTGDSVIPWTECETADNNTWRMTFRDVPAGGLYRIETTMEYEGWDGLSVTRGDMVHYLGVGDIFVITGQSNASGRSKGPIEDTPDLSVHLLRPSGKWDLAVHPLAETTDAVYVGNYENHNPGHSPWLHFAKLLSRRLGYPIGLVPTAYGGAPLRWWNPKENGALLDNALALLKVCDIHPKGAVWYQGEAEGFENSAQTYLTRFEQFITAMREALDQPDLPFVTVQINRNLENPNEEIDRQWGITREGQRQAAHQLHNVSVVPANDVAMYDSIHNSSQGNMVIAERCAKSALSMIYGIQTDDKAPEPVSVRKISGNQVEILFAPVTNWLNLFALPADQLPIELEDEQGLMHPQSYHEERDTVLLTFARPIAGKAVIHGAWRMQVGLAVPCDCMRLPMLSFYGVPVEENA